MTTPVFLFHVRVMRAARCVARAIEQRNTGNRFAMRQYALAAREWIRLARNVKP